MPMETVSGGVDAGFGGMEDLEGYRGGLEVMAYRVAYTELLLGADDGSTALSGV